MAYQPKAGDIIKMHSWHGVVLSVFTNDTGQTVLQVQTARNVFRGYPPEFIELSLAPDAVTPASRADLEKEISYLQQMREVGLKQMLDRIGQPMLAPEGESV